MESEPVINILRLIFSRSPFSEVLTIIARLVVEPPRFGTGVALMLPGVRRIEILTPSPRVRRCVGFLVTSNNADVLTIRLPLTERRSKAIG